MERAHARAQLTGGSAFTQCAPESLRGEVRFTLEVSDRVPPGLAVAPGVRRMANAGGGATVNALTSQRLTDQGVGSTFYDNTVEAWPAG